MHHSMQVEGKTVADIVPQDLDMSVSNSLSRPDMRKVLQSHEEESPLSSSSPILELESKLKAIDDSSNSEAQQQQRPQVAKMGSFLDMISRGKFALKSTPLEQVSLVVCCWLSGICLNLPHSLNQVLIIFFYLLYIDPVAEAARAS